MKEREAPRRPLRGTGRQKDEGQAGKQNLFDAVLTSGWGDFFCSRKKKRSACRASRRQKGKFSEEVTGGHTFPALILL